MIKCSVCGTNIEDGEVFCPKCGQEIQLVPNFETIDTVIQEKKMEEATLRKEQEEQMAARAAAEQEEQNGKNKKSTLRAVILVLIVLAVIGIVIGVLVSRGLKAREKYNSFDYQIAQAETSYVAEDYDKAQEFASRAISLNPDDLNAQLLLSEIYYKKGEQGKAIDQLQKILVNFGASEEVLNNLIDIYTSSGETHMIRELLLSVKDTSLKAKFADYLCEVPTFSLESGAFEETKTLEIHSPDGRPIYYTMDGTLPVPGENAIEYKEPITLPEGRTEVRAVCVSPKEVPSEVALRTYSITIRKPATPVITPVAGRYYTEDNPMITIEVPAGMTCYYAFDKLPTTSDNQYTAPFAMPEGTNRLYAILVNEKGLASNPASMAYICHSRESVSGNVAGQSKTQTTTAPSQNSSNNNNDDEEETHTGGGSDTSSSNDSSSETPQRLTF